MYLQTASVFLSLSVLAINAFKDKCTEKLEGDHHTITLNSARQKGDELIWKCNDTVIYQRMNETVRTTLNVDDKGSLSLTNLNSSMSCTYKVEHRDIHGKLIVTKTETLCVLPRAPVPKLAVKCSSAGVATLHCEHESITSFTLTWLHNNKELREKSNPFQPKQHGEKDHYRCRLSNSLDKQDSKEVTISCGVSDQCTEKLEGDSHTITLNSAKQKGDELIWKCNDTVIYQRIKEKVQSTVNVDDKGSLSLTNLNSSMSCTYKAEHHDIHGKLTATKTERLCVLHKCTEKLEGDSHTITLNSAKQKGDELIWKCNDTVIYQRIKEKVQSTVNVDDKGSLSLTNLNSLMSCTYKAEHHDINGKLTATKTERLCVLPRAPVPKLAVKCSSAGVATLHCEHESITSFTLTWLHNNKELREKSNPFQPKQHGEKDHYRCRLSNSLDKQDSKEVTISCGVSVSGCHVKKFEGESYTMTLNSPQQDVDTLVWKCGEKVIYKRRRGKIDPAADVDMQGSLTLTNISKSMACTYKANHSYQNGNTFSTKTFSERLCVFSRTPDPKLEVECSPSGVATLQCEPKSFPEGITLTWFHNDIEMKNEKSNRLTPQKQGGKDRYKCRLSNGINTKDSNEEIISCGVSELPCVNKLEGDSYTITLNSKEQYEDTLVWKCGDKVIYKRRRGKIYPAACVDMRGSFTLTNISKSMACTYKAEHHDKNGRVIKTLSARLCVFSRTPDPKLEVECSSGVATLQCGPKSFPEGITLTWFHDDIEMKNETSNPLKPQKRGGPRDRYKCRFSNGRDMKDSKEETVSCEVSGNPSNKDLLFGYNKWVMIGIIAGGGFLLLVLIVSLIAICCKNHRRRKRRLRDEEELRLANLQYIGTNSRPRPKQTARGQPVPPTPDEEGYLQGPTGETSPAAPQAVRQPRPRAPPPPMEDDDEAVPPLPQPRRKGARQPDY
ncbi:uncharacterized protein LOC121699061 [Alosa sapidissima]|uniref:uncharacterized protein LOC121699061 n=1 Tax=Alosa sapidissima TaxID=34773 RepID=UPI001C09B817|nr:uncharacterized protein LOC121699061 [Alosa sapidissima]